MNFRLMNGRQVVSGRMQLEIELIEGVYFKSFLFLGVVLNVGSTEEFLKLLDANFSLESTLHCLHQIFLQVSYFVLVILDNLLIAFYNDLKFVDILE